VRESSCCTSAARVTQSPGFSNRRWARITWVGNSQFGGHEHRFVVFDSTFSSRLRKALILTMVVRHYSLQAMVGIKLTLTHHSSLIALDTKTKKYHRVNVVMGAN
jgi:hypothetical protein